MPLDPSLQRLPRYLTQDETRALFAVIADPRDQALFTLIYLYGLRVSEVGLLTRGDVDLDRSRIVVKRLKGGARAERPLFAAARELLSRYLPGLKGAGPASPLFPGNGGPLRKRQIQTFGTRYRDQAKIPRSATRTVSADGGDDGGPGAAIATAYDERRRASYRSDKPVPVAGG